MQEPNENLLNISDKIAGCIIKKLSLWEKCSKHV